MPDLKPRNQTDIVQLAAQFESDDLKVIVIREFAETHRQTEANKTKRLLIVVVAAVVMTLGNAAPASNAAQKWKPLLELARTAVGFR